MEFLHLSTIDLMIRVLFCFALGVFSAKSPAFEYPRELGVNVTPLESSLFLSPLGPGIAASLGMEIRYSEMLDIGAAYVVGGIFQKTTQEGGTSSMLYPGTTLGKALVGPQISIGYSPRIAQSAYRYDLAFLVAVSPSNDFGIRLGAAKEYGVQRAIRSRLYLGISALASGNTGFVIGYTLRIVRRWRNHVRSDS